MKTNKEITNITDILKSKVGLTFKNADNEWFECVAFDIAKELLCLSGGDIYLDVTMTELNRDYQVI